MSFKKVDNFVCYVIDIYYIFVCMYIISSLWSFAVQVNILIFANFFAMSSTWYTSRYIDFWCLYKFIVVAIPFHLFYFLMFFFPQICIFWIMSFWKIQNVSHAPISTLPLKIEMSNFATKMQWNKEDLLHYSSIENIYYKVMI